MSTGKPSTGNMHLVIHKDDLSRAITAVGRVVESRNTMPILGSLLLSATAAGLTSTATDLDIVATARTQCQVTTNGAICVDAKLISDIAKKASGDITMTLDSDKLIIKSGRSRFSLATLPADDFPTFGDDNYDATFDIDLAALFAPVSFAISTEETRYYLNGVFFKGGADAVAVATDGHRLAKHLAGTLPAFEGVIVPAKLCGMLPKGSVAVSVSQQKIRIVAPDLTIVSKLIDGTFPDYDRVIPKGNDKEIVFGSDDMRKATGRVSVVASERVRAVRLSFSNSQAVLSITNKEQGSATEEIFVGYDGDPIEIGFNAAYLAELVGIFPDGDIKLAIADGGAPALFTSEKVPDLLAVLMPMGV